ncbi:MAG: lysophospholipid acyltransferase family protein [Pirellulales bacterium]|nr:lysophospholipid acyltransferase family protein [Pirellulales bacterium]
MGRTASWITRLAGLTAAKGIAAWMRTLEYRVLAYDQRVDPRFGSERPRIYLFWHEYIFFPLYMRPHCNLAMLISQHKDADILARVGHHMGFVCVRGSTNRGGAAALLEMARRGEHMHLAITPDGPRGPRRQLSAGPLFLAAKLGAPIVPLGFGYDRPWRLNSWDKFALPFPACRARCVMGPEIHVPAGASRDDLEIRRQGLERLITDLTIEAEDWARSGAHRLGETCERQSSPMLPRWESPSVSVEADQDF